MANPSPARWLAPLAILGAFLAIAVVISASTGDEEGDDSPPAAERQTTSTERGGETSTSTTETQTEGQETTTETTPESEAETYTVRPGDTFASIAEATGVTVDELEELNPGVDSNSLTVGEEIRLQP